MAAKTSDLHKRTSELATVIYVVNWSEDKTVQPIHKLSFSSLSVSLMCFCEPFNVLVKKVLAYALLHPFSISLLLFLYRSIVRS